MHEALIIMLGGTFFAQITKKLEKENKDSLTKEELFEYLMEAAIDIVKEMTEREKSAPPKNDLSQN